MQLIGTAEIEQHHGITRVQVHRLIVAGDWPEPDQKLSHGRKLWRVDRVDTHVSNLFQTGRLRRREDGTVQTVPWRYATEQNYTREAKDREQLSST